MGKFIRDTNTTGNGTYIKKESATDEMRRAVLKNVTIPMYFYRIIVPQLDGYYDVYPVNFDRDPRACCPLHDEDTPSFRYYEDTESFYCFGCGVGGNIINLHMAYASRMSGNKITKDEAINFLYNYFIRGQETTTQFVEKSDQVNEKLNSDKDIIKLNIYRVNLEKSIMADAKLKSDVKIKLYEALDNVDLLISMDKVDTRSAEKYLKEKVKELITADAYEAQHKLIKIGV